MSATSTKSNGGHNMSTGSLEASIILWGISRWHVQGRGPINDIRWATIGGWIVTQSRGNSSWLFCKRGLSEFTLDLLQSQVLRVVCVCVTYIRGGLLTLNCGVIHPFANTLTLNEDLIILASRMYTYFFTGQNWSRRHEWCNVCNAYTAC